MTRRLFKSPIPAAAWVVVCVFFNCIGWGLSAIHELNLAGYSVAILVGLAAATVWWKRRDRTHWEGINLAKLAQRVRRPFALAFMVLAALALLGGLLYQPVNYDSLAYRTPRVLNWLADGGWHWIHTDFARLNTRTPGFEWMSAPLIAFTGTDRCIFLINIASYLLLPGLIFGMLTRVGVRPRTAWHWMWILPAGYCYLLQAGSIVNDMFGAVFSLAALDFALRARETGRKSELCLSVLAAAMLTGAKTSNLPLLLSWLIVFLAAWRVWFSRPLMLAAVAIPAVVCSFLPTVILNQRNCGDWKGLTAEHATQLIGNCPIGIRLLNNAITDSLENLAPPFFPLASKWNHLADQLIPSGMAKVLQQHFEADPAHWRLGEMAVEENSGLGFGVMMLLIMTAVSVAITRRRRPKAAGPPGELLPRLVCIAPWVGLVYTMSQLGLSSGARYLAPYYPLLLMGFLRGGAQAELVRQKWWRGLAAVGFALALALVVVSPSRPLWPAGWLIKNYGDRLQTSYIGARLVKVYSVYGSRAEAFAPIRDNLPPDTKVVGMVTFDDPETSLWRPFGSRRIRHIIPTDSLADLQAEGIQYALVGKIKFAQHFTEPFESWLARMNGKVVSTYRLSLRAGEEPAEWVVVRLPAPGGAVSAGVSRASPPAGAQPRKIKESPPGMPEVKVPA
jgi:hypothetical protein